MKQIIELISAILLSAIVYTSGIVYNFILFWKLKRFFIYWVEVFKEVGKVILYLLRQIAIVFDILGNVVAGRFFYWYLTGKTDFKDTYFGMSGWTISASTGHLEVNKRLIKRGLKFSKILSFVLMEKWHCINAYKYKSYILNYNRYEQR